MADTTASATHGAVTDPAAIHGGPADPGKRDFLSLLTGAGAVIGIGAISWPLIDSMNPSKDVLALSSVDVDLTPIEVGSGITVAWRGKPVFVRHRTEQEIKTVEAVPLNQLIEPQSDLDRTKDGHRQWIVLIGICTHLGCIPLGNKPTDPRGEWGGWFCPCHGSQYDVSGRVRHGPAPANLALPDYAFESDTKIKVG
jgi:ubiquinol-cytochrome c reductase iron-sulfur subunit